MNETWWINPSQLDDAQKEVLTEPPETDMLILGPPGSGKTNILVLRANYVRSVSPRLLFITFTRTLCEFLRSGPNTGREDQIKRNEISTFMAWAMKLLRDHEASVPERTGDFDGYREEIISAVSELADEERIGQLYDVVFIDEVQDFLDAELQLLRRFSRRVNAAGDSRQAIWKHKQGLRSIATCVDKTVELEHHYRVGLRICEFADQILPPKEGDPALSEGCNYPDEVRPSSVTPVRCVDHEDEFEKCIERLRAQRRYIEDEPIAVLARTNEVLDEFWERLAADPELAPVSMVQRRDEYQAFGPDSLIRVMTVHSAKGSECRAAHILDAHEYGTGLRELAFTAVTRAKTEVVLYHTQPLPGHMQPPTDELPDLEAIF